MKWEDNRRSSNLEDRRAEGSNFGSRLSGGSIMSLLPIVKTLLGTTIGRVILVAGLVLYFGFGFNPLALLDGGATTGTQNTKAIDKNVDDKQADFVSAVLA